MPRVYISIGSNIDPANNIRAAVAALHQRYAPLTISSVYESEAVGFDGDNFLNLVVGFDSDETVEQVAAALHDIEDSYGRDRSGPRFSSRTVDLDLLLYDQLVVEQDKLQLPRDEISKNAFVLLPLFELAPEYHHPVLNKTIAELWQAFDKHSQSLWAIEFDWRLPVTN